MRGHDAEERILVCHCQADLLRMGHGRILCVTPEVACAASGARSFEEVAAPRCVRVQNCLRLSLLFACLTFAACGGSTSPSSGGSPSVTVRLGYFPNLTHAVALVGVARGTFQKALGSNVTLQTKIFNAGPAEIEALFANEIDIGYVGPAPAINGYVKSNGQALRIIAGAASGGALFIVRPQSNIKSASDLAGKKIADPQQGGTQDVALRYYLLNHGLKPADKGGTVQIVPTDNATILTLFQEGRVDGAWVPEPWATRLVVEGNGQIFLDERSLWPGGKFVTTDVIVSTKFLTQHADLVIGAVLIPGAAAPKLVTRAMVSKMKSGAVIVDVAIDQGGCIETARPREGSNPRHPPPRR